MATNYTFSEVVAIIKEGKDSAAIADIGKRFPLLAVKLAKATSGDVDAMVEVCGYIPAKVSANKVNMAIKAALGDDEPEEAEEEEVEVDVPEEVEEEKPKTKRAGKKAAPKKEEKTEEPDEEDDDEEEADPYDGKDAVELYKMCKTRGIAVKPRRTAKFYADALRKADAAAADEDEEDDIEEELPKPTKKTKTTKTAKPAKTKKAKPEPVEEDDEDDEDWDI